jgi:hypothetical protein
MRDRDRDATLRAFGELYFPAEVDDMVRRMPSEREDESGEQFDEYFGMLQTIANAPRDKSLSQEEKKVLEAKMRLIAHKYGYPQTVIMDVEGINDSTQ